MEIRFGYFCIVVAILVAILDFANPLALKLMYISLTIEFPDPENIQLDTKIMFLGVLESKIWLFLYFSSY